jgi:type I restriction enzyme R subunit
MRAQLKTAASRTDERRCEVKSRNFEFLRSRRPELASLGGFAEHYAATDPTSALIKLRILVEQLVEVIYDVHRLSKPFNANLFDLLNEVVFTELVPRVVQQKIHAVRVRGNKAAHGEGVSSQDVNALIRETYDVCSWFHLMFDGGARADIPGFSPISGATSLETSKGQLQREKRALLEQLARQEVQLQEVLADLEVERKQREQLERATQEELEQLRQVGEQRARELEFNEDQTRKFLIDGMLVAAGWDVGPNGKSTSEVGQEVELTGLPTATRKGYADYVLWGDDGKPLAVIEAKKTSKSAAQGRTQATQYANVLEVEHGRRPIIFYTNGVEVFLWDDIEKWADDQGFPPRRVYGFYSKDSLDYLMFQRTNREQLPLVSPKQEIAGRMYQLEAIKRVTERFADNHRKALIVMATGTGKTRVAVSLCDVMSRSKWAKRILFLCDRKELRKQAENAFKEFMPGDPRTVVTAQTASDRDKRIYLATYPAMMKCFQSFDVGFFDLIIADESHRSIYNKHRDLFRYFDAHQVGLTATPVNLIDRNTFKLFRCEDDNPTANYEYTQAINETPPYLVPFRVVKVTTKFQREGIKYGQMTDEQKRQLEEQVADAESVEHETSDIDRLIFNRDTSRAILRNLLDDGIRDASGSLPGKSIIFARNHRHAEHLADVFDELYPRYGGNFCRVIDNYDPKAEQLIDDFKDPDHQLRIAISVDMLDTGIDVPEIVNLVFAKPVKSYVKFWQMIGRGTRLRPNLFGPGEDKKEFLIFDHWGNFEYFDEHYEEKVPAPTRSLRQRVFEARLELARVALEKMDQQAFKTAIKLVESDLNALKASDAIEVRDHWRDLQKLSEQQALESFHAATHAKLVEEIAPLMRWADVRGSEDAHRFDLTAAELQTALLEQSSAVEDLRGKIVNDVEALSKSLNQVRAKTDTINKVRQTSFWESPSVSDVEDLRKDLRSVMKFKVRTTAPSLDPQEIDVDDGDVEREAHIPTFEGQELIAYRHRVENVLKEHFAAHPVLSKIREGYAVSEGDLDTLAGEIITIDPQVDIRHLPIHINIKGDLHRALRSIVGLDAQAVDAAFTDFTHKHMELTSQQLRFLAMLKSHICANGGLEIDRLYEAPFTTINAEGIDGVFDDNLINELLDIIARFNLPEIKGATA